MQLIGRKLQDVNIIKKDFTIKILKTLESVDPNWAAKLAGEISR